MTQFIKMYEWLDGMELKGESYNRYKEVVLNALETVYDNKRFKNMSNHVEFIVNM